MSIFMGWGAIAGWGAKFGKPRFGQQWHRKKGAKKWVKGPKMVWNWKYKKWQKADNF